MHLVWANTARADLDGIYEYIAPDSPRAALHQLNEIERQVHLLCANPHLGRLGRKSGTRELVIARTSYLAVYRVGKERIDIVRIIHGAQRWPPEPAAHVD